MVYLSDGDSYVIKLSLGERLSEALEHFFAETKIEGGWVEALGAVQEVTLGYYDLDKKEYQWCTFDGLREITGIMGNLAFNDAGKMMLHAHGTFGDRDYQVIGGHVKDLVAGATVEIFVHSSHQPWRRKIDEEVGLQTFDL